MKCPCSRHPLPRSTHTNRLNISLREVLNNNVPGEVLFTKQSIVKSLIKIYMIDIDMILIILVLSKSSHYLYAGEVAMVI